MRYLTPACPPFRHVILVESGPRKVIEAVVPRLRGVLGSDIEFHLVTCYPGAPVALGSGAPVFRTQAYQSRSGRVKLARELSETGATVIALVCSGDPIMTRWKWWLAWKLPAKVLLINENADCFWLDSGNIGALRRFAFSRMGVGDGVALQTALRILRLPLVVAYLLLYASVVHTRRALRLLFRSHQP